MQPVHPAIATRRPAFHEIVNEALRRGLESRHATAGRQTFKVTARDLGNLKPGPSLDNNAELIEHVWRAHFTGDPRRPNLLIEF